VEPESESVCVWCVCVCVGVRVVVVVQCAVVGGKVCRCNGENGRWCSAANGGSVCGVRCVCSAAKRCGGSVQVGAGVRWRQWQCAWCARGGVWCVWVWVTATHTQWWPCSAVRAGVYKGIKRGVLCVVQPCACMCVCGREGVQQTQCVQCVVYCSLLCVLCVGVAVGKCVKRVCVWWCVCVKCVCGCV